MEVGMGNINEARAIYKRCYAKRFAGTGSEVNYVLFDRIFALFVDVDKGCKSSFPRQGCYNLVSGVC
jgi:squamous cell carcinoma antigen recognized by T-cells 3